MPEFPRTLLIASVLGLLPLPATATEAIAELHAEPGSLRFALPDFVYEVGVTADFSQLQIVDADRHNVEFAICAQVSAEEASLEVQAIEVPSLARVVTDGADRLQLELSPGARPPGEAQEWVIDTRRTESAIDALSGLPPISELRSGPNLRQWSNSLRFRQEGDRVSFDPIPSPYFRIRLQRPRATTDQRPSVQVHLRHRREERTPQWYGLGQPQAGLYSNVRKLPVIAARVMSRTDTEGWLIQSRQGDWDAWKLRARIVPGQDPPAARLSAVTDPQWRLQPDRGELQLAHPAYEMRIPRVPAAQPLQILLLDTGRFGPSLSCDHTDRLEARAPGRVVPLDAVLDGRAGAQRDLRLHFLILLLIAAGAGLLVRRYRRRRRAR